MLSAARLCARESLLTVGLAAGCAQEVPETQGQPVGTIGTSGVELVVVSAPAPRESTHLPTYLESFDYETADRRRLDVIDLSFEHGMKSLRLTLDPRLVMELNATLPPNVSCELGLLVDRELVEIVHVRAPLDDAVYVKLRMGDSIDRLEKLAERIGASSDLEIASEYAPRIDWNSSIELERTACDARCPQYTIRVLGDGSVIYFGTSGVAQTGQRTWSISIDAVRRLFRRFSAAGFFDLPETSMAESDTSLPSVVTLCMNGRTKRCERRISSPTSAAPPPSEVAELLDLLANAVDGETATRHCVGRSDRGPSPVIVRSPEYTCSDPATFAIKLRRAGGGHAPVYEITIQHDGLVSYRGLAEVAVMGPATKWISRDMVELLVDRMQSIRFLELEDRYDCLGIDEVATTITLSVDGRLKTVFNCWGDVPRTEQPPDLATRRAVASVANAIDAAVDSQAWVAPGDVRWDR